MTVLWLAMFLGDADAAVRQVGAGGYRTIAAAVAAASPGDRVLIAAGRYAESVTTRSQLSFEAQGDVVWVDAAGPALTVTGATVVVTGVSFEVTDDRCVDVSRGTLTLDHVRCANTTTAYLTLDGVGVRAVDATLTVVDTEIHDMLTSGRGTVSVDGGSVTLTRASIHHVYSSRGGGLYATGAAVSVDDSVFERAQALGGVTPWGGAIAAVNPTSFRVTGSQFLDDHAFAGGDVDVSSTTRAAIELYGNTFWGSGSSGGGSLRFTSVRGPVTVTGNLFCEIDSSDEGGGGYFRDADGVWTNNIHIGGSASGGGGGLWVESGTVDVINNSFVDVVGHFGGAIEVSTGGVVDFRNNLITEAGEYDMFEQFGGAVTPRWTALFANDQVGVPHGPNAVLTDPRLMWLNADGLCNDDVRPGPNSPLINAGDPAIRDVDGSRSDIGAYGGPGASWLGADHDGDGFAAPYDCDDQTASVGPNAPELCDGADNDCDGAVDLPIGPAMPAWYPDRDGDGFGVPVGAVNGCTAPAGYAASPDDCDDRRAYAHPGAGESCDGTDEDCNGLVDDGTPVAGPLWYADADGDGHGAGVPVIACSAPAGLVGVGDDCDDLVADAFPGATELCNGVDDNCDGAVDEGNPVPGTWYEDVDGDGFGDPVASLVTCTAPPGWVGRPGDCDDHDADVSPAAPEHCDGEDEDCDALVDEDVVDGEDLFVDLDGDRWGGAAIVACRGADGTTAAGGDCDDDDDRRHPGADERCNDADLNCDGLPGTVDSDGDGFAACDDCDDANADAFPGAADVPYDGELLDCDRVSDNDADGDGYDDVNHFGLDCDDADPAVFPGAPEPDASTVDLDCDGVAGTPEVVEPEPASEGCGCATGGGGAGWLTLLMGALGRRRALRG